MREVAREPEEGKIRQDTSPVKDTNLYNGIKLPKGTFIRGFIVVTA